MTGVLPFDISGLYLFLMFKKILDKKKKKNSGIGMNISVSP